MNKKVLVVGAGPAGLSAAYQLAKSGVPVELFEAGECVGGMARSIELWGQTVDLGPHRFFSSDARVNRFWLEVVARDYEMVERLTRIFYRQRFFSYPLEAVNALRNLGLRRAALCITSFMWQQWANRRSTAEAVNFEQWITRRFGRRLFQEFFKAYSEKLWGVACSELDADFASQRIRSFSLGQAIRHALGFGAERHRTLVDRFAYPAHGSGMVYRRMADSIRAWGGCVHLDTPVKQVLHWDRQVKGVELETGDVVTGDHVISTMPLTLMVARLGDAPPDVLAACRQLRYRNTILVYLRIGRADLFPDQWLYVNSPEIDVGRITNFRNWVSSLCGASSDTILCGEYWCDDSDSMWREDDALLIERASREIRWTGLIGDARILGGHVVRVPRSYPVYSCGYKKLLEPIVEYLRSFHGLAPIGRYGSFKYNNQDHSILMGMLAAENVLCQTQHDLWEINTTYDSYQEKALISATGLDRLEDASRAPAHSASVAVGHNETAFQRGNPKTIATR